MKIKLKRRNAFFSRFPALLACLFLLVTIIGAQQMPDKIRGYKVYRTNISVKSSIDKTTEDQDKDAIEAFVKVGKPKVADVSLTGITLELPAEIASFEQSGTIDFLAFKDFRVNGLAVDVEEYRESFVISKKQSTTLPKPISIFVGTGQTLRGALSELRNSKEEWSVTGTIFVFGQFKKTFMKFKRVVPVAIDLKIKNPVRDMLENAANSREPKSIDTN